MLLGVALVGIDLAAGTAGLGEDRCIQGFDHIRLVHTAVADYSLPVVDSLRTIDAVVADSRRVDNHQKLVAKGHKK